MRVRAVTPERAAAWECWSTAGYAAITECYHPLVHARETTQQALIRDYPILRSLAYVPL
jgi:hypothetical protein